MYYTYKNVKFFKIGTPKGIRTPNLLIRSQMLYPIELWARFNPVGTALQHVRCICNLFFNNGGFSWNRTNDTKIFSLVLCQLSYEAKWRFRRDLNPRSLAWQASVITTTPRNQWLRELDLNQRPLGYEPNELPDCSIPRYYFSSLLSLMII